MLRSLYLIMLLLFSISIYSQVQRFRSVTFPFALNGNWYSETNNLEYSIEDSKLFQIDGNTYQLVQTDQRDHIFRIIVKRDVYFKALYFTNVFDDIMDAFSTEDYSKVNDVLRGQVGPFKRLVKRDSSQLNDHTLKWVESEFPLTMVGNWFDQMQNLQFHIPNNKRIRHNLKFYEIRQVFRKGQQYKFIAFRSDRFVSFFFNYISDTKLEAFKSKYFSNFEKAFHSESGKLINVFKR